ncbi:hypothetical protein [Polaribacter sp. IC073]|uniref:hypothetical protein n=1 Tax=Polaribacter sp. IC073 TaxID=2508540 RepID=UPI0011BDA4A1|nr:hypothetical protein [Polaribacter sp. IC073]TXD47339.1 hypothetical protein ES045_12135 [Polaribacter sp. IC073]
MKKTGGQIEYEIYNLWKDLINEEINGTFYLRGTRPINSDKEDAIISFMTGLDDQMQTGALNINIYVPDIDIGNSNSVKNIARCNELEAFMLQLTENWTVKSEYKFTLGQTINTFEEDDIHQHFVNVKLKYKRLTI